MHGIPLPEGKTASEKKLISKVRGQLGLPPEPKTPSEKEKFAKAHAAGLIVPLEGKSPERENLARTTFRKVKKSQSGRISNSTRKKHLNKRKIVKGLAMHGVPLPEAKTPSEKKMFDKLRTDLGLPPEPMTPEDKENYARAQAAGLFVPLEAKTPAEKKIMDKVRADLGLPPTPKTAADKERYGKAAAAGILVPLEGKTPQEKEKILRAQAEMGIPLPEGRTPSEKAMIQTIKATVPKRKSIRPLLPPDEAKTAPSPSLEGKSPAEKEKILRSLARQRSLPEGKTPSEKAIIQKVRADIGLRPPYSGLPSEKIRKAKAAGLLTPLEEPKTPSMREKHRQAYADGIMTPLEGKPPAEKEKILKRMHDAGITLPEGKTPSEKELDVTGLVDEIISQKLVSDTSSIFVVVPATEKDPAETRFSSTICIEMSEYAHKWNNGVVIRDV
ncbi:neurofilament heavy polypeptide-like, partial [Manduca sexta]|uniref:neurofilament heavy polypeptide-like n=1 Tax=Manduca sexta TaxID=7130 RepID=UPI00188F61E7